MRSASGTAVVHHTRKPSDAPASRCKVSSISGSGSGEGCQRNNRTHYPIRMTEMIVYQDQAVQLLQGDVMAVLKTLPDNYVQTVVTSPPYWGLRDYGTDGQIGLEKTPELYVAKMIEVFREVKRVLKDDGTLWLNLGDTYTTNIGGNRNGHDNTTWDHAVSESLRSNTIGTTRLRANAKEYGLKPKDLVGIPWRVAFALQADGWYLRSDIIWSKPNPMPESVTDRPTKAHEYLFLLAKSPKYYYDNDAIKEPMSLSSEERLTQPNLAQQQGSDRVQGKTNGAMKAVGTPRNDGTRWNENNGRGFLPKIDKQRGHGRRHDGFNDRWDAMEKADQCSGMRNKRTVWEIATQPYAEAHFATFPEALIEPCILAGAPIGGLVLDPFSGAGTTLLVSKKLNRTGIGIELNPEYCAITAKRLSVEPARLL